jgi:hypothetical protein
MNLDFPDQNLADVNRKWDHRRVVWTKDQFYVARPNSLQAIESLPLNEIQAVMEMNDEPDVALKQASFSRRSKSSLTETKEETIDSRDHHREIDAAAQDAAFFSQNSATSCVLQIKTVLDSVIAGRTLYLSTRLDHSPEQQRQAIVSSLCDAVAVARKKALVMSSFQKTQEQVRRVQGSFAFQMTMASLIILVSARKKHNSNTA